MTTSSASSFAAERVRAHTPNQNHSFIQNYFLQSEWEILRSETINQRMRLVVSRCIAVGLHYPNEPTLVRLVGLLFLARQRPDVRPEESIVLLRDLKCIFKSMRKTSVRPEAIIPVFPATNT
jgi:hypothetical protein